jgi:hypothetical protein
MQQEPLRFRIPELAAYRLEIWKTARAKDRRLAINDEIMFPKPLRRTRNRRKRLRPVIAAA